MEKVKVSREVAEALDRQGKSEWTKQFNLTSHCKGYSSNGVLCKNIYKKDFIVLEELQPLEFARCLILGYEIIKD